MCVTKTIHDRRLSLNQRFLSWPSSPTDPMGKMFFNIVATFGEFEADLIRMRSLEGMAFVKAKGKLRGKRPKLSEKQQKELWRMHDTGEYSISDLAEVFSVSRPTVYRTLNRRKIA